MTLEIKRAKEILQSQTLVNVSYRGIPIYIQDIDEERQMAKVFPIDEMDHEQDVDLEGLHEL